MYRSCSIFSLFLLALAACRPEPRVEPVRAGASVPYPGPQASGQSHGGDSVPFEAIRYIQLQRAEDSSTYFTQDDCRCTMQTAEFRKGRLTFASCDSVYPEGNYTLQRLQRDSAAGLTVFATRDGTADTIVFRRAATSPAIYEIRRSNLYDIESGVRFISSQDSAKFEHRDWNCSEYDG